MSASAREGAGGAARLGLPASLLRRRRLGGLGRGGLLVSLLGSHLEDRGSGCGRNARSRAPALVRRSNDPAADSQSARRTDPCSLAGRLSGRFIMTAEAAALHAGGAGRGACCAAGVLRAGGARGAVLCSCRVGIGGWLRAGNPESASRMQEPAGPVRPCARCPCARWRDKGYIYGYFWDYSPILAFWPTRQFPSLVHRLLCQARAPRDFLARAPRAP